jgi:fermentation-respiration switch protein FrsA (DUF1100 family)
VCLSLALATVLIVAGCGSAAPPAHRTVSVTTADPTTTSTTPSTTVAPPTTTTTVAPTTTTSRPAPPYPVVERTVPFVDASRPTVSQGRTIAPDRPLTTEVWLPSTPGPWPLVLFAAGYDVGPETVATLLASWASRGYVVAAPEFPLADPAVFGAADVDENDLDNEPDDARFVLRSLLTPADPLRSQIDAGSLAVTGHSDGAEVALSLATTGGLPAGSTLKAAIIMSGQPVPGATGPNPPMLVTQGDADTINPPSNGTQVFQAARPPKYYLTLLGGGHLPPLQAGSAWLPTIEQVTGDFLDAYVAGAPADVARLEAAGNAPGLTSLQVTPAA